MEALAARDDGGAREDAAAATQPFT